MQQPLLEFQNVEISYDGEPTVGQRDVAVTPYVSGVRAPMHEGIGHPAADRGRLRLFGRAATPESGDAAHSADLRLDAPALR